jgi:hypothetical protein
LLNLISGDSSKAEYMFTMLENLSRLPVELTLSVSVLYLHFGFSFVVSLAPLLLSLLLNSCMAKSRKQL